jgi:hypothetical protein
MLKAEYLQELAEAGFRAVTIGKMLEARKIFEGILTARPDHAVPLMGLAMSRYMVDEFEAAENILRGIISREPDFQLARAHLALTLLLADRSDEAVPILRELEKLNDPLLKDMVADMLEKAA